MTDLTIRAEDLQPPKLDGVVQQEKTWHPRPYPYILTDGDITEIHHSTAAKPMLGPFMPPYDGKLVIGWIYDPEEPSSSSMRQWGEHSLADLREDLDRWARDVARRAYENMQKWGLQSPEVLALAMAEEAGEVAQAVLQWKQEGADEAHITDEAMDLAPLCLQMLANRKILRDQEGEGDG